MKRRITMIGNCIVQDFVDLGLCFCEVRNFCAPAEEKQAAVTLQAVIRGLQETERFQQEKEDAAVPLQEATRGMQEREPLLQEEDVPQKKIEQFVFMTESKSSQSRVRLDIISDSGLTRVGGKVSEDPKCVKITFTFPEDNRVSDGANSKYWTEYIIKFESPVTECPLRNTVKVLNAQGKNDFDLDWYEESGSQLSFYIIDKSLLFLKLYKMRAYQWWWKLRDSCTAIEFDGASFAPSQYGE